MAAIKFRANGKIRETQFARISSPITTAQLCEQQKDDSLFYSYQHYQRINVTFNVKKIDLNKKRWKLRRDRVPNLNATSTLNKFL